MFTEWTGAYGYNLYGFSLECYWFWSVFSPSHQVNCDLQQFDKSHLWVELKLFFSLSLSLPGPYIDLRLSCSEQPYQVSRKECFLTCTEILIFWRTPEVNLMAGLWHCFPGLQSPLGNSVCDSFWKIPPQPVGANWPGMF